MLTPLVLSACAFLRLSFAAPVPNDFMLQVAATPAAMEHGLMWRENIPTGTGMIFVFDHVGPESFWMKNTPSALDMVALGQSGKILSIYADAKPWDTSIIPMPDKTQFVIELPAGDARAYGLKPGELPAEAACDP